jgi:hypothetical protein
MSAPDAVPRCRERGIAGRVAAGKRRVRTRGGDEMGCLLALFGGIFPRFGLFLVWILRPARVDAAFDTFILPLLGIIFLPFATLIYVLLYTPGVGLRGWEWFWVVICALLDIGHWGAGYTQRASMPGYQGRATPPPIS